MKVCIAEKPSVAREIAAILGANTKKDGYLEGNGYQVTWTYGHLCTLKEPHDYHPEWKGWNYSSLPIIPARFGIKLIEIDNYVKQFKVIEQLIAGAEEVINCGDAGQEGELIQRWVMQKALCKCPVKRLWISSLTEESIREGFNSLKDNSEFQRLYEAGLARAIGDWLLGMNATRIYTLKYGANRQVLSIGRVQTPTLALIVNRFNEIKNFVPEPYWELKTLYRDVTFSSTKGKYKSEEEAREALKQIEGHEFEVTSVTEKKGTESAPKLFDLTSLQVECNKKFSYSADETLKLIQSLYEKKLTTYPRVDTTFLSDDLYPKMPATLRALKGYEPLVAALNLNKLPKSKKVFDNSKVTDHHAIIPTGYNNAAMTEPERKVYDLVVRHFIANFYPECKISTTTVMGDVNGVEFKVTGKRILEPGWRVVFEYGVGNKEQGAGIIDLTDEKDEDEGKVLPQFVKGERGEHTPDLAQKQTSPPKLYTEATLLRAMETAGKLVENEELRDAMKENGIGRPSTRAAIIETLFKRNYIRKVRKSLEPTQMGVDLIATIQFDLLKSAELTGQWEKKLRDIEKGTFAASQFIDELKQMVGNVVLEVMKENPTHRLVVTQSNVSANNQPIASADQNTASKKQPTASSKRKSPKKPTIKEGAPCPKCGKGVIIKGRTAFGCSLWREGCDWRQPFE
ncbi:MAG: DNA topoisomerase 3 [Paludibacteraceae bacterium]|nr:DNA topoisomerase 3 [Paludibacteraceae bacterium]